jgi:hypothetical protein
MTINSDSGPVATTGKLSLWTGRMLSGLFVAFMVFDVAIKLVGMKMVDVTMTQLGYDPALSRPIGIIEAICVIIYVIPATAVLGAVLMMGVLGGAVATHIRVGDPMVSHVLFGVYLGLFMWGGIYLRDPRLRAIFPVRR